MAAGPEALTGAAQPLGGKPVPSVHMRSMSNQNIDFQRGEQVTHPTKGVGSIYQDQAGFKNAMVEFDDRPNVVIGVPAGELKRRYLP